ncbi:DNA-directed RNA polymerase subunit D [Methanomethylovorans sp.]|uniref:DNA-directed RNA polymerase subunit D n=1 Tax=Methanomethylovorans sp. TaxID=2758717 RepID=UPI00345E654F
MTMEVDILELSDRSAKFVLSNTTTAFANGIRRAALADVPTLAITEINIYNNTSVLYDEQLGLRLALVPLTSNMEDFIPKEECNCGDFCPACQVSLTLSAEGPGMVYSQDLVSSDDKVQPADPNIPIADLREGQKIVLEAIAQMGYGNKHSRWQAGVACGYKNMPIVEFSGCDQCGKCVTECPVNIIKIGTNSAEISTEDMLKCTLCRLCVGICEIDAIDVKVDEHSFIFTVESDGSYSTKELILNAGSVIKDKATSLSEILSTL